MSIFAPHGSIQIVQNSQLYFARLLFLRPDFWSSDNGVLLNTSTASSSSNFGSLIIRTAASNPQVLQVTRKSIFAFLTTYKKIKRLTQHGLIHVARIEIDDSGKKVVYYKSKVKRMQFGIEGENLSIQFENNALLRTIGLVG